jgi:uncharacterized protein (TIGR02266 family)
MTALPLVRVRLKYPDLDTFAERFAPNVTRGGIFLASREPRPVGTVLCFEVSLMSGTPVLTGKGKVTWTKAFDPKEPSRPYGMGVQFTELDPDSRPVLDRLLKKREQPGRPAAPAAGRAPAPVAERGRSETAETQPLRRPPPIPRAAAAPPSASTPPPIPLHLKRPPPLPVTPPAAPLNTPTVVLNTPTVVPLTPPAAIKTPPLVPFPLPAPLHTPPPTPELGALDQIDDISFRRMLERARQLAGEVDDVEALARPTSEPVPTLAQALAELPRYLGLRSGSEPVH